MLTSILNRYLDAHPLTSHRTLFDVAVEVLKFHRVPFTDHAVRKVVTDCLDRRGIFPNQVVIHPQGDCHSVTEVL